MTAASASVASARSTPDCRVLFARLRDSVWALWTPCAKTSHVPSSESGAESPSVALISEDRSSPRRGRGSSDSDTTEPVPVCRLSALRGATVRSANTSGAAASRPPHRTSAPVGGCACAEPVASPTKSMNARDHGRRSPLNIGIPPPRPAHSGAGRRKLHRCVARIQYRSMHEAERGGSISGQVIVIGVNTNCFRL